jgi:hypothetical protein
VILRLLRPAAATAADETTPSSLRIQSPRSHSLHETSHSLDETQLNQPRNAIKKCASVWPSAGFVYSWVSEVPEWV